MADKAPEPAKPQGAAVIRRVAVTQEDAKEVLLKRTLPVVVTSGAIHFVLIAIFVLLFSGETPQVEAGDKIVETVVEDKEPEPEPDLTNQDLGFEAELDASNLNEREEVENVEAPVVDSEPVGTPMDSETAPTQTMAPPGADQVMPNAGATGDMGPVKGGDGGAGGAFAVPGMNGRSGARKNALLAAGGGNSASEAAVARGLAYLARKQKLPSGHWVFDGSSAPDTVASTGMCLLPFLAAGETHKGGGKKNLYAKNVDAGLKYLIGRQKPTGDFTGSSSMYATAIATVSICEAYGMTRDPALKKHAQLAINFIQKGQGNNGSWGYSAGSTGDTSIVGWQVQALKSAKISELAVNDEVLKRAANFLDSVSTEGNSRYGYTSRGGSPSLTSVGLLSRVYIPPGWGPRNLPMSKGVEYLLATALPKQGQPLDMYTVYYATQVVYFYGGQSWSRDWNPKVRDLLVATQSMAGGPDQGSWAPDSTTIGSHCGRLGTTCMCLLTLEVYYRHLPLYKRDNGGLKDLD